MLANFLAMSIIMLMRQLSRREAVGFELLVLRPSGARVTGVPAQLPHSSPSGARGRINNYHFGRLSSGPFIQNKAGDHVPSAAAFVIDCR